MSSTNSSVLLGVALLALGFLIGRRPALPDIAGIVCPPHPMIEVVCDGGGGFPHSQCIIPERAESCTDMTNGLHCTARVWPRHGVNNAD